MRRGRRAASRSPPSSVASRDQSAGASRSARASAGQPHALERAARGGPDVLRRAWRQRQRAGQRLAPVGEAGVHERHELGRRRGCRAPQQDERRVDVRDRMEDGARHLAQEAHLTGELGEHGGRAVAAPAGRRREPVRNLALEHRHPERGLGQLGDRLEQHRGGDPVGQIRHDLPRRRVERAEVEPDGIGQMEIDVRERIERVAQRLLERAVDLDHVQVADARREVLGQDAESATHLEHHVDVRELGGVGDEAQDVVVDQEVLPELAVRPDPELPQAAEAGLTGSGRLLTHGPNTRTAFASTVRSSSSYATPRSAATWRAVWTTLAGSLRLPRSGCGDR